MRARIIPLLALSLLAACEDKDAGADDSSPGGQETGETADTDGAETGDTDPTETGDTDSAETGETGETDTGSVWDVYDWSGCPGADSWVGEESWAARLEATEDAVYCSAWSEERTLEQELAAKALLRLPAGSWPLPAEAGEYSLALPVCTLIGPASLGPAPAGAGSTTVAASTWSGTTYTTLYGEQPLDLGGSPWYLDHVLLLVGEEGAAPWPFVADGHVTDDETGAGMQLTMAPEGTSVHDVTAIGFGACDVEDWTTDVHHLSFEGGEITLTLRLGDNISSTAPGAFTEARGSFDGVDFTVTDTFQLIYRPGHHHFERHFAVIFDEPVGEVCALRVEAVDPWAEEPSATVSTADCALGVTGTRAVTAQSAEIES